MRWELNNYLILRYLKLTPKNASPFGDLTVLSRSSRFPEHEVSAKLRQYKRIVPGQERIGALGTNSLIQIHERPSVYPPLERSAIKTDSSMDDGGIRPAVNQTTKFLVSARAPLLGSVEHGRCRTLVSLSLSFSLALSMRKGVIMRPWVRTNRARRPIEDAPSKTAYLHARSRASNLHPHFKQHDDFFSLLRQHAACTIN